MVNARHIIRCEGPSRSPGCGPCDEHRLVDKWPWVNEVNRPEWYIQHADFFYPPKCEEEIVRLNGWATPNAYSFLWWHIWWNIPTSRFQLLSRLYHRFESLRVTPNRMTILSYQHMPWDDMYIPCALGPCDRSNTSWRLPGIKVCPPGRSKTNVGHFPRLNSLPQNQRLNKRNWGHKKGLSENYWAG